MTPHNAEQVNEAVRLLLTQPGADATYRVDRAQLADGSTVRIEVKAFIPDRSDASETLTLLAGP